jgi:hypothetical protein
MSSRSITQLAAVLKRPERSILEQARSRLTDRIAEGRADAVVRRTEKNKDRGPMTR